MGGVEMSAVTPGQAATQKKFKARSYYGANFAKCEVDKQPNVEWPMVYVRWIDATGPSDKWNDIDNVSFKVAEMS